MKPIQLLHVVSITALTAILLFSSTCAAAGGGYAADPRSRKRPLEQPSDEDALPFLKDLDPRQISDLTSTDEYMESGKPDPYTEVVFGQGTPLHDMKKLDRETTQPTVEQALRDFGAVGLLDKD